MPPTIKTRLRRHIEVAIAAICITAALMLAISLGAAQFSDLTFDPTNGSFQNFNGMHRLAQGQWPGRDYTAYLGFAAIYLPYVPFRVLGETYAASTAATFALHGVLFVSCTWILAILAGLSARRAAMVAAIITALTAIGIPSLPGMKLVLSLFNANNSALGLRSAAAPLLIGLTYLANRRLLPELAAVVSGAVAATALLWSNDYGIPTAFACLVLHACAAKSPHRSKTTLALFSILSVTIFAILLATLATGAAPLRWAEENFRTIPSDQYWYYVIDAADKPFALTDLPFGWDLRLTLLSAAMLIASWLRNPNRLDHLALSAVALASLAAGWLAYAFGMPLDRYFAGAERVLLVALPTAFLNIPTIARGKLELIALKLSARWKHLALDGSSIIALGTAALFVSQALHPRPPNTDFIQVPEMGGTIPPQYAAGILKARQIAAETRLKALPTNAISAADYSTAFDLIIGATPTTRQDYAIHALGDTARHRYLAESLDLAKPYATTPRPGLVEWETWNERANWWFYRDLLARYEPIEDVSWYRLWRHRDRPRVPDNTPATCSVSQTASGLSLTISDAGNAPDGIWWVEAEVTYQARVNHSIDPLLGDRGLIRVTAAQSALSPGMGPRIHPLWSLPIGNKTVLLPIEHRAGQPSVILLDAFPTGRAEISAIDCSAHYYLPMEPARLQAAASHTLKVVSSPTRTTTRGHTAYAVTLEGAALFDMLAPGTELVAACKDGRSAAGTIDWVEFPNVALVEPPAGDGNLDCLQTGQSIEATTP